MKRDRFAVFSYASFAKNHMQVSQPKKNPARCLIMICIMPFPALKHLYALRVSGFSFRCFSSSFSSFLFWSLFSSIPCEWFFVFFLALIIKCKCQANTQQPCCVPSNRHNSKQFLYTTKEFATSIYEKYVRFFVFRQTRVLI